MTTLQVLRAARELLVTAGWCQLGYTRDGCFCSEGAINRVTSGFAHVGNLAGRDAKSALESVVGRPPGMLIPWNDRRDRTQADVLAAFDRAIAAEVRS